MITEESEKQACVESLKSIQENALSDDPYLAVPLNYFLKIKVKTYGCDIFIKLNKTSGAQYIKLLPKEECFTRDDLKRYFVSGLEQVFILRAQFPNFLEKFEEIEIPEKTSEVLFSESLKINRKQLDVLNIDEMVVKMVEESVAQMMKNVGQKNALAVFIKKLQEESLSYNYSRVYLITLLMFKVLDAYDWNSISIRKTITFACFFHDISLNSDEFIKIKSKTQLEKVELSKEEKDQIYNHAAKSAEILDKFPRVPMGASTLVREHHGVKSGQGFTENYPANLSPLTVMFIVVEDFVGEFLDFNQDFSKSKVEQLFDNLEQKYSKSVFCQALTVLRLRILQQE